MSCSAEPQTCACDLNNLLLGYIPIPHMNFKLKTYFQDICSKIMYL